jgi:curved DNA-binding protein CbpA
MNNLDYIYDSKKFIDLYEILEIDIDSSPEEIKSAYLKLCKVHHPDRGGESDKFEEVTRAYEILYDKKNRKEYDLYYLNKNSDEFTSDSFLRLKNEFNTFIAENSEDIKNKTIKFDEFLEKTKLDLEKRSRDLELERKKNEMEYCDENLTKFLNVVEKEANINEIFEYLKYKKCFDNNLNSNELIKNDLVYPIQDGNINFAPLTNEDDSIDSQIYSNLYTDSQLPLNLSNHLNIDEFGEWKKKSVNNTKLTNDDIDLFLKKRDQEKEMILDEIKEKTIEGGIKLDIPNEIEKIENIKKRSI